MSDTVKSGPWALQALKSTMSHPRGCSYQSHLEIGSSLDWDTLP